MGTNPTTKVISTENYYFYFTFKPALLYDTTSILELNFPTGFTFNNAKLSSSKVVGTTPTSVTVSNGVL